MRTQPLHVLDVTRGSSSPSWLRWPVGLILIVHGLIHTMGVLLLFELAEPGDLTYAMARPEPGTPLGMGFAILWGVATVLFVLSGYQLVRGRDWAGLVVTASVISLLVVGAMASSAPVGVVISTLTLILGLWYLTRHRLDQ